MADPGKQDDEKKIIIDEDWKSQVEAEKAAMDGKEDAKAEQSAPAADQAGATDDDPEMPPASLDLLISTLVTEAMVALGAMPHPANGQMMPRRNQAKYLIDMIEVIKEKTAGNIDAEETQGIDAVMHQLRMAFVNMPAGES